MQIQTQHDTLHLKQLPAQGPANLQTGKAAPASTGSGNATSSSSNSATITANDFLSLLVAEMKNQDPTSAQDPNAYIDQLVQVNSLQQLIQINQDLGSGAGSTTSTSDASHAGTSRVLGAASSLATSLVHKPTSGAQETRTERVASAAARSRGHVNAR